MKRDEIISLQEKSEYEYNNNNLEGAIQLLKKALSLERNNLFLNLQLAEYYFENIEYKEGIKYYKKCEYLINKTINIDHVNNEIEIQLSFFQSLIYDLDGFDYNTLLIKIYSGFVKYYNYINDITQKEIYLNKCKNLNNNSKTNAQIAGLYLDMEEYLEASQLLYINIKNNFERELSLSAYGYTLFMLNELDKAEQIYKIILKENKNNIDAYMQLGNINGFKEKYEESIKYFNLALLIDENLPDSLFGKSLALKNLAVINNESNYLKESLITINKALNIHPDNHICNNLKGEILVLLSENDQANKYFIKAITENSNIEEYKYNLARNYYYLLEYEKSINLCNEIIKQNREATYQVYLLKSLILNDMGQYLEAKEIINYIKNIHNDKKEYIEIEELIDFNIENAI